MGNMLSKAPLTSPFDPDKLPHELLIMILERVPVADLLSLASVNHRMEDASKTPTLPEGVCKIQFAPYWQLYRHDKNFRFDWSFVKGLAAYNKEKIDVHALISSRSSNQVASVALALADFILAVRDEFIAARDPEDRDWTDYQNEVIYFSKTFRQALPITALSLLRYMWLLVDETLKQQHQPPPPPADVFEGSDTRLCQLLRFVYLERLFFENIDDHRFSIVSQAERHKCYPTLVAGVDVILPEFEMPVELDPWHGTLTLNLAMDQTLKRHFDNVDSQEFRNLDASSNSTQADDQQPLQEKLVARYEAMTAMNQKIYQIFENEETSKPLIADLDLTTVGSRLCKEAQRIRKFTDDEREAALQEELEALDLHQWPSSSYLSAKLPKEPTRTLEWWEVLS